MSITNHRPKSKQFLAFERLTLALESSMRANSAGITTLSDLLEKTRSHPVFTWLLKQENFRNAADHFKVGRYFRSIENGIEREVMELKFAGIIAFCIAAYLDETDHPKKIFIAKKTLRKRAIGPIKKVLDLMKDGVVPFDIGDREVLESQLKNLSLEISENKPTFYPTRRDDHLPRRLLVQRLGLLLHASFEVLDSTIITDVVLVVDPDVDQRAIRKILVPIRDFLVWRNRPASH